MVVMDHPRQCAQEWRICVWQQPWDCPRLFDRTPDYIYLLNPDTQVRPGAIAALVRFLTARPDVGIAGGSFENLDGSDWPIAFRFPTLFSEVDAGLHWGLASHLLKRWVVPRVMTQTPQPVDWICGASMMIRPAVLRPSADWTRTIFCTSKRLISAGVPGSPGHPTWYVPESRVMHVMGQSTGRKRMRTRERDAYPPTGLSPGADTMFWRLGLWRAAGIDVAALLAHSLGHLKRILQGRRRAGVPHFIRDLVRHSGPVARKSLNPRARRPCPTAQFSCCVASCAGAAGMFARRNQLITPCGISGKQSDVFRTTCRPHLTG